ncbi:MAG: amidase [Candidatus Binataceae bacterium]
MINPYIEAWDLRQLVLKKEIRPREVADFFLARIEKLNPKLGAFMTVTAEHAHADAAKLEQASASAAAALPLYGVAYSLKDLLWTKDIRTTFGSKNYENWHAPADSDLAVRLRNSGGILLGKTTTPEFGARPTTEGGLCPPARNPWNLEHTAGGSSGGAGAAVAAGLNPVAQGSDGGGSIRIPSSCCGIVGIKPSRGRITSAPTAGEGWGGFSTTGPMARTVRDAVMMLDAMAGHAHGDPYAAWPNARSFLDSIAARPKKLKLAMISETALGPVDPATLAAFEQACEAFTAMGHRVEPINLDPGKLLIDHVRMVVMAGVGSNRIENPELMDPLVRSTWEYGGKILAADYIRSLAQVHNTAREIVQHLMPYDALLTPTITRPAVKLGTLATKIETAGEEIYGWTAFVFPFNATGQPAITLPNGFNKEGLPIGVQIVGRPYDEAGVIALGAAFEEARPWKGRHPAM